MENYRKEYDNWVCLLSTSQWLDVISIPNQLVTENDLP